MTSYKSRVPWWEALLAITFALVFGGGMLAITVGTISYFTRLDAELCAKVNVCVPWEWK